MSRLLVLKHETEEAVHSAELRYLLSSCVAEARKVFERVDLVTWRQGAEPPACGPEAPALVLGAASAYVAHRSLAEMRRELEDGCDLVLPLPLEVRRLSPEEAPQTLRAYERLEERLLARRSPAAAGRDSHLPVALFSRQAFEAVLARHPIEHVLTDDRLLGSWNGRRRHAGLYYEFNDYYGEAKEEILSLLPDPPATVLEVGCGRGLTGALLRERLGCHVTGVELNPVVARDAARRLDRVLVGDVMGVDLDGRYDAIVATEVLEHLPDSEAFLVRMRQALNPGGRIVLSVPNVGYFPVVEDLLAGRWDYIPMGLLCYTHLRFFTRATLEDWISRLGFRAWEIRAQTTELPERFRRLAAAWRVDEESLRTAGFYVVLES